jgi:hypothetical protein
MTLRERLADWISGGALTRAQDQCAEWKEAFGIEYDEHQATWSRAVTRLDKLRAIEAATRYGKFGTARKINRMAREALK